MTDNDIYRILIPLIQTKLTANGFVGQVKQSNQPTQQGANTDPAVYIFKIGDKRYGFNRRNSIWDEINNIEVHTEEQCYESTYQIDAWIRQNPSTPNQYTASDYVNEVASILQSDYAIDSLMSHNIGILRITDIRNPYFKDDRDQFEASPSFDFTITYVQTRTSTVPVVSSEELKIYRV